MAINYGKGKNTSNYNLQNVAENNILRLSLDTASLPGMLCLIPSINDGMFPWQSTDRRFQE